ncbi:MAG: hypothetical protein AAGA76_13180 [Pseudomonadota bacterium]
MASKKPPEDEREREAKRILERVAQDSETVGTSSMRRVAERMRDHVSAEDADQNDWAEVWGTRIGRILSVIFFIGLLVYLVRTYVLHA